MTTPRPEVNRAARINLATFQRATGIARWLDLIRTALSDEISRHTRRLPTPNRYRERDLGMQLVAGQRVRCKQVRDTAGLTLFVVGPEFRVS